MNSKKFHIHFLVRLAIFWMAYFAMFRMLFIVYHHTKILDGQHNETGMSFLYGIRLDLSTASVAMIIPFVLWAFQQYHKSRLIHLLNLAFNCSLIIITSALSIFNLKIYGEWDTLLGYRAFKHLLFAPQNHPFFSFWSILLLLFAVAVFAYIGIRAYRKYVISFSYPIDNSRVRISLMVAIPIALFITYRGGLQAIPISEKESSYSEIAINNSIATNNIWYFVHSMYNAQVDEEFKTDTLNHK